MDPSASKRRQRNEKMSSFYRDLTDSLHNTVAEYMNDVEHLDDEQEQEVIEVKQALSELGRTQRDLRLLEQRCMEATMRGLNEVKAMLQEEVHLRHSSERRLEERCDRIDRELAGTAARDRQGQPASHQVTESLRSHTRRLEETNRMLQEEVHLRNVAEKLLEERCDKLDLALAALQANTSQSVQQQRLDFLERSIREMVEKLTAEIETVRQQGLGQLRDLPRKLQDVNHMLQEEMQVRTNCERHLQERCDHMEEAIIAQRDVQVKVNDLKSDTTTAHQRIDHLEAIVDETHSKFTKDLQGVSKQFVHQQPLPPFQELGSTHQQHGQPQPEFQQLAPTHQHQMPPEQPAPLQQFVKKPRELHHPTLNQQQELPRQCSAPGLLNGHVIEDNKRHSPMTITREPIPANALPPQVPRAITVHRSPSARGVSREVREVRAPSSIRKLPASPAQIVRSQQVMAMPCDPLSGSTLPTCPTCHRPPEVRYVL